MRMTRPKANAMGLNLTSMIDVVFLLLIYFMVATEFKTAEESFPMDLPMREHGQTSPSSLLLNLLEKPKPTFEFVWKVRGILLHLLMNSLNFFKQTRQESFRLQVFFYKHILF